MGANSSAEEPSPSREKKTSHSMERDPKEWKPVMKLYRMDMSEAGMMGAGTSSICRKGEVIATGEPCAIKVYKTPKAGKHDDGGSDTRLMKFRRQIAVLKDLLMPWEPPEDPALWHSQLEKAEPGRLFMKLLDYSKNDKGEAIPDPDDGQLYVITELASYSLKDYLAMQKGDSHHLSTETVKNIAKALVLVMAGLHAKGLVHLDMKPENLMVFDGQLKLIDVDGCVKVGTPIAVTDPSISFSPCYCAPEWANFLIEESESTIIANPCLDVWSVGCTICELVTLDAILKPMYANFLRHSRSHREAGFLFMDWLSSLKKAPIPKAIAKFDPELAKMLDSSLLVCDKGRRKTCAQCLSEPYLREVALHRSKTNPLGNIDGTPSDKAEPFGGEGAARIGRIRPEDISSAPMHQGFLWKLNTGSDMRDRANWLQRDMWITNIGSLCYYSLKENKRLVLLDPHRLHGAKLSAVKGAAYEYAFQVKISGDDSHEEAITFGCDTAQNMQMWMRVLQAISQMDTVPTFNLGAQYVKDRALYKISVKNRRMKVSGDYEHQFEPVFKAKLWKLKTAGDPMVEADWFERDTWLSRNGSLVYWSVKQNCELVYYTSVDVAKAAVQEHPGACKPHAFQVSLPIEDGIEFAPGEFAANSVDERAAWMQEWGKFQVGEGS